MQIFDFHCDTLFRMEKESLSFNDPTLQLHSDCCKKFDSMIQVFALWADSDDSDDAAWQFIENTLRKNQGFPFLPGNIAGVFAIEDARVIGRNGARLQIAASLGVKILTFFWEGVTCLGGAWNTTEGLSYAGRHLLEDCLSLGMIPDISHASVQSAKDILYTANQRGRPVIASHGGCFSICSHNRNFPDEILQAVAQIGGLIGIDMVPSHLTRHSTCTYQDVAKHVHHLIQIGCRNAMCLGCDFDGTASLPHSMHGADSLGDLAAALRSSGLSADDIHALFWENGFRFAQQNLWL